MQIQIISAINRIAILTICSALSLSPIVAAGQMSMPSPASSEQGKQQTWTGEITTAMCKAAGGSMGHDCILNCIKAGQKYVLMTKGGVQAISNQDFGDLKEHAGHRVKITGQLGPDGKSITVTNIEMAAGGGKGCC